ncbi:MAG: YgiT-type zinc finger protein [Desulfomonilaceae bacterium]
MTLQECPTTAIIKGLPAEKCENCGEILWAQIAQRYHLTETGVDLIV